MIVKTKSFEIATYERGDLQSPKLAISLPGKLDSKDYADMRGHVDFLANIGFHALSFDPPGTWESPGDIGIYNVTNYLKSINELIEYYGNKPTFLVGHSRGGSMAMLAGMENPNVLGFASLMSFAYNKAYNEDQGSVEWESAGYIESLRDLPPGGEEKTKIFKLPYSFYLDQIKYDLTEDLKKCTKPKLFVAGSQDTLVKPEIVKAEFEMAPQIKEYYEVNCEHDYRFHPDKIKELNGVIKNFLGKYWK